MGKGLIKPYIPQVEPKDLSNALWRNYQLKVLHGARSQISKLKELQSNLDIKDQNRLRVYFNGLEFALNGLINITNNLNVQLSKRQRKKTHE